ncbi:carbohydrate ABC transporter permease [Caproicibacter sp.]|uniref:carbohydrate ABC transporter permease n=1 Tax=Caproicibacter sp. TaxID=2814884 RepID=UPI003989B0AF
MKRIRYSELLMYFALSLGGLVSVLPMIYMLSTSLKPNGALYEYPPHFFPDKSNITIKNYIYIFQQQKFYINFINSLVVSLLTVVLAAAISTALAFCIARFRFPGRRMLFGLVVATMIIPGTALIVPQFELATFLHITNELWGLIPFYVAWVIPFSTFMIKGFIEGIRAISTKPSIWTAATYLPFSGRLPYRCRVRRSRP